MHQRRDSAAAPHVYFRSMAEDVKVTHCQPMITKQATSYRPSPYDRKRLSIESLGVAERTILRVYLRPSSVREATWLRVCDAARRLGLHPPPEQTRSPSEVDTT